MANNNMIIIPGRLHSVAEEGHVSGANEIYDDVIQKDQQTINADVRKNKANASDVYDKLHTYSKEQLNNLITTPNQNYVTVYATDQTTAITDVLPVEGTADTIYRVGNWNGEQYDTTCYSEYAWDGTIYQPLSTKNPGIDDEIKEGSRNNAMSGAVAKLMASVPENSTDCKFALVDSEGNIIAQIGKNDKMKMFVDLIAETLNGVPTATFAEDDNFKWCWVDVDDNLLFGITKDNKLVSGLIDMDKIYNILNNGTQSNKSAFYERNMSSEPILVNDARYDIENTDIKRLQLAVITDTHTNYSSFQKGIDAATDFISIDATVFLGDACNAYPSSPIHSHYVEMLESVTKPLFMTPGNHDVGDYSQYVRYCQDDWHIYERWIKPSVDKGFLIEGEYQEGRCYYYHDFDRYKVRLIMLYPFDDGNVLDQTYWRPIPYDESYPLIKKSTQYYTGDRINVDEYDSYSFEAVQNVYVTVVSSSTKRNVEGFDKLPRYKALRMGMWYGYDQLNWLCSILDDAGEKGYICIIGSHFAYMDMAHDTAYNDTSTRFDDGKKTSNYNFRFFDPDYNSEEDPMHRPVSEVFDTEPISAIVNAYQNQERIALSLHPFSTVRTDYDRGYDDCSDIPDVNISYAFQNTGSVLFIHGHNHRDSIARHNEYSQMQIGFLCNTKSNSGVTVNRTNNSESIAGENVDCITVYKRSRVIDNETVIENTVHISRVGNACSSKIDNVTHSLVRKDNEVLTF